MGLYDPIKIKLRAINGVEKYEEMGDSGYHIGSDDNGMRKAVPEGKTWGDPKGSGFRMHTTPEFRDRLSSNLTCYGARTHRPAMPIYLSAYVGAANSSSGTAAAPEALHA